ncbi:MAG: septum site-determining protein MinD, partial [Gammaproteobacteria bacterium]|nr:septum site-determining protein MinD [Gammaproteobacteria bacterium]
TRVEDGEMLSVDDIIEILAIPLLGAIPESESVLQASNTGVSIILDTESKAGQAYDDLVERFLGNDVEHRFLTPEKKGFFSRVFGG